MFSQMGSGATNLITEYYPVLIDPTQGTGMPADSLFIDKNGMKVDAGVVNAVLNGVEIDTSYHTATT